MDKMKFNEFKEKLEKCNKALNEAVNKDKLHQSLDNIMIAKNKEHIAEKKTQITYQQAPGKPPLCGIQGSKFDIAFALEQLMDFDDDFYNMLSLVCACRRVQEGGGFIITNDIKIDCKSEEQRDILRELYNKSPEELKKIKKDLFK